MVTQTQSRVAYQLTGNPVIPVPVIGNLVFDDLGQVAVAKLNERFKDVPNIEDNTKYKLNQPISFSNTPRALIYNQILLEETNGKIHVLSPAEVVRFWNAIPERPNTYADTNSGAAYPKEGPNKDLKQRVLNILGIQDLKVPLLVEGLGIEKADNKYGFTFTKTDYTASIEAPFLTSDGALAYDPKTGKLVKSKTGVPVYTPNDQSGFRGVYQSGGGLVARGGDLVSAVDAGRVRVVQGAFAPEKNLEAFVRELEAERNRQIEEKTAKIKARHERALKVLIEED